MTSQSPKPWFDIEPVLSANSILGQFVLATVYEKSFSVKRNSYLYICVNQ